MANSEAQRPLLAKSNTPIPVPFTRLSKVSSTALLALGSIRAIAGVGCLLAPQLAARAFLVDLPTQAGLVMQVAGSREIVLGALTLESRRRVIAATTTGTSITNGENSGNGAVVERDVLKKVLLANIVADSLDVVCCLVGEMTGSMSVETAGIFGGAAAVFVALGCVAYRRI